MTAMTPPPREAVEDSSLPQCGFNTDVDFDALACSNHFLFRVYTPRGPTSRTSDPYFIAPKFDVKYNSPLEDSLWQKAFEIDTPEAAVGTYEEVAKHMDWTTRQSSPFVSTSFSFIWSIWEALRRYHSGVKKDVEIAIIDARVVSGRAVTGVQILRGRPPSTRRQEHWKWHRFSHESQSVLVRGFIPARAVLASIPLLCLLQRLPSYFLRQPLPDMVKYNTLATIGWDYTEKKNHFRGFCQEMSDRFLQLSPEARLQDTTTGSVRLAISFLRPWFHAAVLKDFDLAVEDLCSLSYSIAHWPGQWALEHPEIRDLIQAIVVSIAEEIRESQWGNQPSISATLTRIITENEQNEHTASLGLLIEEMTTARLPPALGLSTPPMSTIPMIFHPPRLGTPPRELELPPAISRSSSNKVQTPITPPDTPPRQRTRPPSTMSSDSSDSFSLTIHETPVIASAALEEPPSSPTLPSDDRLPLLSPPEELSLCMSEKVPTALSPPHTPPRVPVRLPTLLPSPFPRDPVTPPPPPPRADSPKQVPLARLSVFRPPSVEGLSRFGERLLKRKRSLALTQSTMVETGACIVTGFLVGAFITLCLLAPQRRALLHLT